MEFLGRLWRGEVSLGRIFWIYRFFGVPLFAIANILLAGEVAHLLSRRGVPWVVARYAFVLFIFTALYDIFVNLALWRRCRHYEGWKVWSFMARLHAISSFAFYPLLLFFAIFSVVNPEGYARLGDILEQNRTAPINRLEHMEEEHQESARQEVISIEGQAVPDQPQQPSQEESLGLLTGRDSIEAQPSRYGHGIDEHRTTATIYLKNGNTLEGSIEASNDQQVTIDIPGAGKLTLERSEIASIDTSSAQP